MITYIIVKKKNIAAKMLVGRALSLSKIAAASSWRHTAQKVVHSMLS